MNVVEEGDDWKRIEWERHSNTGTSIVKEADERVWKVRVWRSRNENAETPYDTHIRAGNERRALEEALDEIYEGLEQRFNDE